MKKTSLILALALIFVAIPAATHAFVLKSGQSIYIAENEIINGNFYAAGNNVTIDGTINGDIFVAGQNIIFNGTTTGDIFAAGETITINGKVGSSLRAAGNTVNINNNISGSVHAFGATITTAKNTVINGDFFLGAAFGEFRGTINGDLHGGAASIVLAGEITGDVKMRLDERAKIETKKNKIKKDNEILPLYVRDSAVIGGNLYYTAGQIGEISEKAQIAGEIGHNFPDKTARHNIATKKAWGGLFSIFSSLVIGLVLISLWREPVKNLTNLMLKRIAPAIGIGAVVMLLTPIIALLLAITIIGIPLAAILIAVWLIAICISKTIIGILIGQMILNKIWEKKKDSLIWAMIIGVILVWMITSLPLIGWLFCLTAIWWALGGMWLYYKKT